MTKKRRSGKALAERRRRTMQLHLAEFTQEEIADKLGVHRLRRLPRSAVDPRFNLPRGIPRRSGGILRTDGKNDLQPGTGAVRPLSPTAGRNVQPRGRGRRLGKREEYPRP